MAASIGENDVAAARSEEACACFASDSVTTRTGSAPATGS